MLVSTRLVLAPLKRTTAPGWRRSPGQARWEGNLSEDITPGWRSRRAEDDAG